MPCDWLVANRVYRQTLAISQFDLLFFSWRLYRWSVASQSEWSRRQPDSQTDRRIDGWMDGEVVGDEEEEDKD